jgi:processive 1,2-diacylglycerol beta-glucosyltransferase
LDFGVKDSNILYNGPVFNSRFNERSSEELNKEFSKSKDLDINLPIVEIISGGASLPKGFEVFEQALKAIDASNKRFQIALICGRNKKLMQNAENLLNKYPHLRRFVKLEGFSKEVYEWMNIATIIISKAGPGIMQEAWALQKPFFACNYIWPQEEVNFGLITQKNVGIANQNPVQLINNVVDCLQNPDALKAFENNLMKMNYRSNINQVAKDLLGV